eukprot:4449913-Prymnesium_polylepis.1
MPPIFHVEAFTRIDCARSSGVKAGVEAASADELKSALASLPAEAKEKLKAALGGEGPKGPFTFASGLPDCCTASPE